jgi:hypothetical protein
VLEHLDDELGRQLWQERHLVLQTQLSCGGSSGPGEEISELVCENGSLRGLLRAEVPRSGRALAGGGEESGEGRVSHFHGHGLLVYCEFTAYKTNFSK